jgi:hypothetical protein
MAIECTLNGEPSSLDVDPQMPSADTRPPTGAAASKEASREWRTGHTIPAEYYYDQEHWKKAEHDIAENFWLLADRASRIPKA